MVKRVMVAAMLVGFFAVRGLVLRGEEGGAATAPAEGVNAAATESVASLSVQWHFSAERVGAEVPSLTDPVAAGGVVYFGDSSGGVRAADPQEGKILWSKGVAGSVNGVVVDDKQVYATGEKGLVALAKGTGEVAWRLDAAGGTGNCVRDEATEMVYVGGMDGVLYAVDRNTGAQRWTHSLMDEKVKSSKDARLTGTAARPTGISTDGGLVFASVFDQSRVVACDAGTGEEKWSFVAKGWIYGAAAFDDRRVFIGAQDDYLYCLEKVSGEVEWKFKTKSRVESTPLVLGGLVIVPSCDGFLYAVKIETGEVAWKFEADHQERVGEKGRASAIYSKPLLCRRAVWFAAGEGHVYGLNAANGKLLFKMCPLEGSEIYSSLAADERHLFVTTRQKNGHHGVEGAASGENAVFGLGLEAGE